MHSTSARRFAFAVLLLVALTVGRSAGAQPFTFIVNSAADLQDGNTGDGVCDTGVGGIRSGSCTLRAALEETQSTSRHPGNRIHFNIPGGGVPKIRPRGDLFGPLGTFCGVTIDGTTQPGTHLVELDGLNAGVPLGGLPLSGLELSGSPTGQGITVRGLVINNFDRHGILIQESGGPCNAGQGDPNLIESNFIGTDPTGLIARPNGMDGVHITKMGNNLIGNATGGDNLISGNRGNGVVIEGKESVDNYVRSNFIGTNLNNNDALPNEQSGVVIRDQAKGTFIGGSSIPPMRAPGNTIGGNREHGVYLVGQGVADNFIQGNHIGVLRPNGGHGVFIDRGNNNVVGDRVARDPNAKNLITNNRGDGIRIIGPAAIGNYLAINSVFDNGGLGIDLGGDGVTPNDALDADTGPNTLLNFPESFLPLPDGSIQVNVHGPAGGSVSVDFFVSVGCDPSGFGEGQTYIGTLAGVMMDARGNGSARFIPTAPVQGGLFLTAMAWDPASENFSEFSRCASIIQPPPPPPPPPPSCSTLVTGTQDSGAGSLRSAIECANARPGLDTITFNIPGSGSQSIHLTSSLPTISDPVIIDGYSQPGANAASDPPVLLIELEGSGAGPSADGVRIAAPGSVITGLVVTAFNGNGVVIEDAALSRIEANIIRSNGGAGIAVRGNGADGNRLTRNALSGNDGLGIDLDDDGVTPNDPTDADVAANDGMNFPVIGFATGGASQTAVGLTLQSRPSTRFTIELFSTPACDPTGHGEAATFQGTTALTTDGSGRADAIETLNRAIPAGHFMTATATDPEGNTSELSACVAVATANQAPVLAPLPPLTRGEGSLVSFTARASDPNVGDQLRFSLAPNAPSGASIDPASGLFAFTPPDGPATYTITVRVNDSGDPSLSDEKSFVLTVTNVSPVASAGPDRTVTAGTPLLLTGTFTDPGTDTHTFGWQVTNSLGQVVATGTGQSLTFTPSVAGTYTATFTVTDDDGAQGTDGASITATTATPEFAIARPDIYFAARNTRLTVRAPGVLRNDFSSAGSPLTAQLLRGPRSGTLTLAPDGSFIYVPRPGFRGFDFFFYRAVNSNASSNPTLVILLVL